MSTCDRCGIHVDEEEFIGDELVCRDCYVCPDDEEYECYKCGNPTGRGYDSGVCAECLGE